jgi:FG-GAP-like repeat
MEAVARSGAKYWRFGLDCFSWYGHESTVWQAWDHNFELAWEHGITVLPTLSSRCTTGSIELPSRSEWEPSGSSWEKFAKAVVEHYGINGSFWSGKSNPKPVENWEIQNEPNLAERGIDGFSGAQIYAEFFKRVAETLQAAQGSFFTTHSLVGGLYYGDINDGANRTPHTFMQEMNAKFPAVKPWVYGVAIHPYEFGANSNLRIWEDITQARSDVNSYLGTNKPLWITEIGWPVQGHNVDVPAASLSEQEGALKDLFKWVKQEATGKNIQALIFYMYRDDALGNGTWAHFCGLRSAQPVERYSQSTFRPAWYAFQEEVGAPKWPVAPYAESQAATNIGTTEATLHGIINPHNLPTGYHFEWAEGGEGFSHWLPAHDTDAGWKEGNVSESVTLTGLKPGMEYHFRIVSTNENHETYFGANLAFTTPSASPAVIVDNSGVEHIYSRSPTGQLEEWYQIGTRWSKRRWGPENNVAGSPSAVVDKSGRTWVYFRTPKGQLRDWWFQGTNWAEEEHGYENRMGGDPAVIEDTEGRRWVYFRGTNGQLKSWWFQGASWAEEGVGSIGIIGDPKGIAQPSAKREVFYFGAQNAPYRWRLASSEATLDAIATLLPFKEAVSWGGWSTAFSMSLADVNGDGKADIVGRESTGTVLVGLSNGSLFTSGSLWSIWPSTYSMEFADVDGGGRADIVGRETSTGTVKVGLSTP